MGRGNGSEKMAETQSSDFLDEETARKRHQRRRLRHKIVFQWVIPAGVGVFSFVYWFLLFPLVWSSLPVKEWHFLWFAGFGLGAFVLWVAVIAPFVWLWHSRQEHLVELPPLVPDDAPYPTYPTKAAPVQPKGYSVTYKSGSQDSFIAVPAQKDGATTPSLYNAKTGRDSFQSGHYLDESEPSLFKKNGPALDLEHAKTGRNIFQSGDCLDESELSVFKKNGSAMDLELGLLKSECQPALTRENSGVQLSKKLTGEGRPDGHRPISISSCSSSSSSSGLDLRRPADGVDSADVRAEVEKAPLVRDESFQGLPDMGRFDAYLHLVTVDTPMSPREEFFKDMGKTDEDEEEAPRRDKGKSYHPGTDLEAAQKRIAAARKSLPPLLHYPDLELGEERAVKSEARKTTTHGSDETVFENDSETGRPKETKVVVEDEVRARRRTTTTTASRSSASEPDEAAEPKRACFRTLSEGRRLRQQRTSDEFFVSHVARLDSVTSEARLEVQGEAEAEGLARWETRSGSIARTPPSAGGADEGRFVVMKGEYARNYVEAFIGVEREALGKERLPARRRGEEGDGDGDAGSDSVFLEF